MVTLPKKFGTSTYYVTQSLSNFTVPRYGTAFKEWQYKLKWAVNWSSGAGYLGPLSNICQVASLASLRQNLKAHLYHRKL